MGSYLVDANDAAYDVHHHQFGLPAVRAAQELGEEALPKGLRIAKHLDRRERTLAAPILSPPLNLLHRSPSPPQLLLLLPLRSPSTLIEGAVDVLLGREISRRRRGVGDVPFVVRVSIRVHVIMPHEKFESSDGDARAFVKDRARDDVDRVGVRPHAFVVHLREHAHGLLRRHLVILGDDAVEKVLHATVEALVAVLGVAAREVGDDVREHRAPEELVVAAEQGEEQGKEVVRLDHLAVPQKDERLHERTAKHRIEDARVLVEELHELGREARAILGIACGDLRDEVDDERERLASRRERLAGTRYEEVSSGAIVGQLQSELIVITLGIPLACVIVVVGSCACTRKEARSCQRGGVARMRRRRKRVNEK